MSLLLMDEKSLTSKSVPNHSRSRVLKSHENIIKKKCNKSLKKKLKKYKLRKDGQEDPDIIDVSETLINSLRIKSPNNQIFNAHKANEENRPHNYLTKMVKLKTATIMESTLLNINHCNNKVMDGPISLKAKADQDKKQTDAFKLLMDSRNKAIGSNSPGKEKCEDNSVVQEKVENKELRAKRILSLNRMAQSKGSLKRLEIEEYREKNIKRKMENRARKFKRMIVGVEGKSGKKDQVNSCVSNTVEKLSNPIKLNSIETRDSLEIESPIFKTFDLFRDMKVNLNTSMKKISKEDKEFLKKLSPSIRKKENMLSYFQKVSKDSDTLQNDGDAGSHNKDQLIIKVKLKSRNKATKNKNIHITGKVTKLIENMEKNEYDPETIQQDTSQYKNHVANDNNKKRKRNSNIRPGNIKVLNNDTNGTMQCYNNNRPKRNTKKPVKYAEDFQLSSSDEELHIFTPKKKRKEKLECEINLKHMVDNAKKNDEIESGPKTENVKKIRQNKDRSIKKRSPQNDNCRSVIPKKETKLAPIFVSKTLPDSAAIEAKQKFLQSGVPSQLKKISHQNNMLGSDEFQKVVHIQNFNYLHNPLIINIINALNTKYFEDIDLKEEKDLFKKLLQVPVLEPYSIPKFKKNVDHILQYIKKTYPKFPVYRTYHLLKGKSKGEFKDCIYPDLDNSIEIFNNMVDINNIQPDKLSWADKYKPMAEKQVIGNFESIRELRRWLVTWTENDVKLKKNKCESDSSDFYQSDTDSRQTTKNENNLLIITGKVGTGKTLSVYAVAAELAIKVIEVNASAKRTGKIMLQDLQEATQSHKVDRGKNSTECSQKSQEICTTNSLMVKKKRGRKKKTNIDSNTNAVINKKEPTELTVSQENIRTGMSLILIDDADIVFDQDDGFCYAISQLIQSSKRPVILVTSSLTCPHLQKFMSFAKILKMRPFLPRMLGTWLDIMCLVDNNICSPGFGAKMLDLFKGDIRKTINYLQFYLTSHKHLNNKDNPFQDEEVLTMNVNDENSCMSWGDNEGWGEKNIGSSYSNDICKYLANKESQLFHFLHPLNIFYVWWNLPRLLNYSWKYYDHTFENLVKIDKVKETKELNKIANVLDKVSMADYLGTLNDEPNITSGPWQSFERDSVIDNENFATFNGDKDCINEILLELTLKSIAEAKAFIDPENKTEINYPNMSIQRERDVVVSRHQTLTKCLNPSIALDRRALALDYWSSCRSICRAEKSKTNTNSKRNNRFCHYLKSLNIVCRNKYFDNLGESLCFKK